MTIDEQIVAAITPLGFPITPWSKADPNARTRFTYLLIAGSDNGNLSGAGVQSSRYQIDLWCETLDQARLLAADAKVALRAGLIIGRITDNPDDYEQDTKLTKVSFDIAAWAN
jgi:hypothetical protein